MHERAVVAKDRAVPGATQPYRVLDDRVEDRLHVGGRAGDDAQDLAGGRLLLERLGDLSVGVGQRAILLLQ
jgi:hypothetical protein